MGSEKQKVTQAITVTHALGIASDMGIKRTRPWLIYWAKKAGFGFQLGGSGSKWVIDEIEYRRFLDGKNDKCAG